ncbi:hypothetical protein JW823_03065 [bacterium]|nr:hypothetical protein [candidate division CSSED10-310 bacterium]
MNKKCIKGHYLSPTIDMFSTCRKNQIRDAIVYWTLIPYLQSTCTLGRILSLGAWPVTLQEPVDLDSQSL